MKSAYKRSYPHIFRRSIFPYSSFGDRKVGEDVHPQTMRSTYPVGARSYPVLCQNKSRLPQALALLKKDWREPFADGRSNASFDSENARRQDVSPHDDLWSTTMFQWSRSRVNGVASTYFTLPILRKPHRCVRRDAYVFIIYVITLHVTKDPNAYG